MNSKTSKCISVLACLGIVLLFTILTIVWIEFYNGSFRTTKTTKQIDRKYMENPANYTVSAQQVEERKRTKESRQNSYLESLGLDVDVEYVKPMKISPLPLHDHDIIFNEMNNYSDQPVLLHHSGHFRHNMAEIWDPHPHYELTAFGKKIEIQLAHDNKVIMPNLHVSRTGVNYTHRKPFDRGLLGCYYTGNVQGDKESDVVVSLCNGMTGYIRTSDGTYYIEPVENFNGTTLNSFLHRIKKVPHISNEVTPTTSKNNHDQCGTKISSESELSNNEIHEEYPIALDLHNPIKRNTAEDTNTRKNNSTARVRKKRDLYDEEYLKMDDIEDDYEETHQYEYFIKVLVVADRSMVEFYKTKKELDHYIVTLMAQTARLFKDPSIGNAISVSVVDMRILEKQDFQALNSQQTLTKFCKWREKYTVHSNHDVALLLTRHDFCKDKDQECVTVGVARVGAMCTPSSCAVAIDKGLPTAYTIAHEIGHTLNMPHDTDDKKRCANLNKGETQKYIMTHSLDRDIKPWMWSPCSKNYVTEFLRSKKARCLLKRPTTNFLSNDFANILPGVKYELEKQCEFEFGKGRNHCNIENESPCLYLWCTENLNEGCSTRHMPWAEGTSCGVERWCHNGECISFKENDLKPVQGGWTIWSQWGECSRTCGGGVQVSTRVCSNPVPENGGDYCFGASVRYASCNTQQCPDPVDFRAVQCGTFNGNTHNLTNLPNDIKWLPKYGLEREDQCKLYCRPEHSEAYYLLRSKVIDGTKCGFNSYGICVDGKCMSGGCDNKLHSKMKPDDCGVCGGDNSQCEEISGSYNITATSTGYNTILKFPKGSSHLDIKQKDKKDQKLKSYLALIDGETGKYILNGNNIITEQQKDIIFGGSILKYSGSRALVERITTAKNEILTKPLILEILTIDSHSPPPDITYEYIISKENAPSLLQYNSRSRPLTKPTVQTPRYSWRLYQKEWTKCNSICSGYQFMKPVCIELGITDQIVDDYFCASRDTHGIVQKKECNNHCRLIWNPVKKTPCSAKCGVGTRNVTYECMKIDKEREKYGFLQIITAETYGDVVTVSKSYCDMLPQPQYTETCTGNCNVRWSYTEWSQCSQSCGGGVQTRTAQCLDNDTGLKMNENECKDLRKITERECKNIECPKWFTSEWSQCSSKCGRGYKVRQIFCKLGNDYLKEYFCDRNIKPIERTECSLKPCVEWATSEWSSCSASCGNGIEKREAFCQSKENGVMKIMDLSLCSDLVKPDSTRRCNLRKCFTLPSFFHPRYSYPFDTNHNNTIEIEFKKVEWVSGSWTPCSKSCGGGLSYRKVICRGDHGEHSCNIAKKPVTKISCNTFKCPQWQSAGWSECDESCEKHRIVVCRNNSGITVSDLKCDSKIKPGESMKCKLSQCPHLTNTVPRHHQYIDSRENLEGKYRWKIGSWKECSTNCGKGTRHRNVTCEDSNYDVIVVDQYCKSLTKPKTSKPCERYNCAFTWIESDWSPCSTTCGNGFKTRNVTCHKVYPGGLIDPNPMPYLRYNRYRRNYCDMYRKPDDTMRCKESNCGDSHIWRTGPWKDCSHKCGRKGRQTRQLYCIKASNGEKSAKRLCSKHLRPKRKRKCNQWKCAHKSCSDVKYNLRTRENKDYLLDIRGKKAVVYCFKMDTREPEEFISLMSDIHNYAEFYGKRLSNLNSCPFNGERNDNCDCIDVGPKRSGLTRFYKVRLDIKTMKIIGSDFTFVSEARGKMIPYGTAGDCYSKVQGCGQGRFSIDLTGTSFKIANDVDWIGNITTIHKTDKSASGKCGGFCGDCEPDFYTGLHVEVT